MSTLALRPDWLDPQQLISTFGLIGILIVVFAECGLLIGFFLPGDSLLFTTGLLVAERVLTQPLWLVCLLISVAAVAGNQVGYAIGRRAGPAVFRRPNSRLFKQEYVDKTSAFFAAYGGRAIVLARFVPIVRTFITVMAGAGRMDYRKYTTYTLIGGLLWGTGVTVLGYFLGQVPVIRNNIEAMLVAIVAVSVLPMAVELLRGWLSARRRADSSPQAATRENVPGRDT